VAQKLSEEKVAAIKDRARRAQGGVPTKPVDAAAVRQSVFKLLAGERRDDDDS
jgi:hypothetical protein